MCDLGPALEQAVCGCSVTAAAAAMRLLEQGALLDELVAVLKCTDRGVSVTVARTLELLADAPELTLLLVLSRGCVPPGYLPWIAVLGPRVAWGAFRVAPMATVEA
jgi:hypothetical protein